MSLRNCGARSQKIPAKTNATMALNRIVADAPMKWAASPARTTRPCAQHSIICSDTIVPHGGSATMTTFLDWIEYASLGIEMLAIGIIVVAIVSGTARY